LALQGSSLRIQNLTVTIDGKTVLDDIDFALESGSYLVVLGPSGSGKTTLLRTIAGLLDPASGSIIVDGQDVTALPPWKRGVAFVQQIPGLLPHLTVEENIVLAAELRAGLARDAARSEAWQLARMLGIEDVLHRRPGQLSGGQLQRAAIAVALATRARILLLDEPLSHLDRPLAEQLRNELKRLHQTTGITIVHVTHDQDEALALATHIAVLIDGRLEAFDKTERLYFRPPSKRVAEFLGHNVFEAERLDPGRQGLVSLPPEAIYIHLNGGYKGVLRSLTRERGRVVASIETPAGVIRAYIHPLDAEKLTTGMQVRFDVDWSLAHRLSRNT